MTPEKARLYVIDQLQDAMFEMSFDPEGTDPDHKELFDRCGDIARGIMDLTQAEVTAVDEDGNAHLKFHLAHINTDELPPRDGERVSP
jgi:hypothetical protein